ncbi:hypothetical protein HJG60_010277 [Phyllostomus discolor]|uniref:Uncharacterized protein n=1 Tax=Phyllostomus discolor TaxID=89673 RepID=A0A834AZS4_9CHIR|nr:hypothetical protein HJG60_010277 [Phyllostomus discolor]
MVQWCTAAHSSCLGLFTHMLHYTFLLVPTSMPLCGRLSPCTPMRHLLESHPAVWLAGPFTLLSPLGRRHWGASSLSPLDPHPTGKGPEQASSIATQLCPCGLSSPDTQQTMRLATQCPAPNVTLGRQQPWATTGTLLNLDYCQTPNPISPSWISMFVKGSC